MRFPLSLTLSMAAYIVRKKLAGVKRFPLVLMLEPLHACNLTCTGCGRIREYSTTIKDKLSVAEFRRTPRFSFNVHLDGLEETHDKAVEREGVFRAAVAGIKEAKAAGFRVTTNTTVYQETDLREIDQLFAYLTKLGVDNFMLSPAYGYA